VPGRSLRQLAQRPRARSPLGCRRTACGSARQRWSDASRWKCRDYLPPQIRPGHAFGASASTPCSRGLLRGTASGGATAQRHLVPRTGLRAALPRSGCSPGCEIRRCCAGWSAFQSRIHRRRSPKRSDRDVALTGLAWVWAQDGEHAGKQMKERNIKDPDRHHALAVRREQHHGSHT
jgi:hypothetical protein